jgi:hypothetical protein
LYLCLITARACVINPTGKGWRGTLRIPVIDAKVIDVFGEIRLRWQPKDCRRANYAGAPSPRPRI